MSERRSANVIGLGLIGGSISLALRRNGFEVWGSDSADGVADDALGRDIIDRVGVDRAAEITFVATPVNTVPQSVRLALETTSGVVTDVGSVKAVAAEFASDPRYIPGHPMAGSELHGLDGADASMFEAAVWVLTPTESTSDSAFNLVAETVTRLGAEVVALQPAQHDDLVAMVSHVPHLTAATLMGLADERSEEHLALLRLAAGGFRDMTRIASGSPAIWLDICEQNREAILRGLDGLISGLSEMRDVVDRSDREALFDRLERARVARMNLPVRAGAIENLAEMRIPIPDRPGSAAEVFALSGELGVNIHDFEVVHSVEGDRGIMVLVVRADHVDMFRGGLLARGYRPAIQKLS
ncbi:MAG: putative prephenate dehydrogenase [Actinomycetota bacterium]|nr:prephenate dehydrogenase/arogenate dehydrogenase family protein [Actinomycetota bacterium]